MKKLTIMALAIILLIPLCYAPTDFSSGTTTITKDNLEDFQNNFNQQFSANDVTLTFQGSLPENLNYDSSGLLSLGDSSVNLNRLDSAVVMIKDGKINVIYKNGKFPNLQGSKNIRVSSEAEGYFFIGKLKATGDFLYDGKNFIIPNGNSATIGGFRINIYDHDWKINDLNSPYEPNTISIPSSADASEIMINHPESGRTRINNPNHEPLIINLGVEGNRNSVSFYDNHVKSWVDLKGGADTKNNLNIWQGGFLLEMKQGESKVVWTAQTANEKEKLEVNTNLNPQKPGDVALYSLPPGAEVKEYEFKGDKVIEIPHTGDFKFGFEIDSNGRNIEELLNPHKLALSKMNEDPEIKSLFDKKKNILTPAVIEAIADVATKRGIDPKVLLQVITFETGGSLRTNIVNPDSGAVGLIQFTKDSLWVLHKNPEYKDLTLDKIGQMSAVEQLKLVDYYYGYYIDAQKPKKIDVSFLYCLTLAPNTNCANPNTVMYGSGPNYDQNRNLDTNHNNQITVEEASARVTEVWNAATSINVASAK